MYRNEEPRARLFAQISALRNRKSTAAAPSDAQPKLRSRFSLAVAAIFCHFLPFSSVIDINLILFTITKRRVLKITLKAS